MNIFGRIFKKGQGKALLAFISEKIFRRKKVVKNENPQTYKIGGCWADHVQWFDRKEFDNWEGDDKIFNVWGHKPRKPVAGDILIGEFKKSFIHFEFISVKYEYNPPDMFFGKVRPIKQVLK